MGGLVGLPPSHVGSQTFYYRPTYINFSNKAHSGFQIPTNDQQVLLVIKFTYLRIKQNKVNIYEHFASGCFHGDYGVFYVALVSISVLVVCLF